MTNTQCPICNMFANLDSLLIVPHGSSRYHVSCVRDLMLSAERINKASQHQPFVLQDAKPCRRCERGVPELVKLMHTFFCKCQSCGYAADSAFTQDAALSNWEKK